MTATQADAIELLEADHRALLRLFAEYADLVRHDVARGKRRALAQRICTELAIHSRLEDELFYPAARDALGDEDLLDESGEHHAAIGDLMAQVLTMRAGDPLYDARVAVLREYTERHIRQEREQVFARLRGARHDLGALGRSFAQRKQELHTVADALREEVLASALL